MQHEQADIRGEYWIRDGYVDYADGDIGDRYSNPALSKPNKWNAAAQRAGIIGPGQELWRGTSESKYQSFLEWLDKKMGRPE